MDQVRSCSGPYSRSGSGNAGIARASQLQHAAEGMHSYVNLSRTTFVQTRAYVITDHLLPSSDCRLGLGALVVPGGLLPGHATFCGDTLEVAVALCRGDVSRTTWHCRGAWRHDHRRLKVTFSNSGVNSMLIVGSIAGHRRQRIRDLVEQSASLSAVIGLFAGQR